MRHGFEFFGFRFFVGRLLDRIRLGCRIGICRLCSGNVCHGKVPLRNQQACDRSSSQTYLWTMPRRTILSCYLFRL
jgi:hypothetical protein